MKKIFTAVILVICMITLSFGVFADDIKDGITFDYDGNIRFYKNGEPIYAGVVMDDDGNYYYINSSKKAIKSTDYNISNSHTNGLIPAGSYHADENGHLKPMQGLVQCSDGTTRYYVDGVPTYAGLVIDSDGYLYYINSSCKAVTNCSYTVSKVNGIIPCCDEFMFDETGRAYVDIYPELGDSWIVRRSYINLGKQSTTHD